MLQTNLIFGIQKKIKEGKHSTGASGVSVLEESTDVDVSKKEKKEEILLENYYNPGIVSGVYEQVKNSQKQKTHKKVLMTEAFHLSKAKKKLQKDITYFNYLYENFVPEVFQDDYQMLLENIFEDTIRLYQECDVTPRVISPAIDSNELSENQIVDLYKNSLNQSIKNQYTKPLLSGKISELFESEIRTLTKKLLEEGVTADVDQVRVYLPFEETLYRFNKEVIIPKAAASRMESFMESMTSEYTDLLEETAGDIIKAIEQKIKLLTSMVAPGMFDKAVDAEGVDAPKMAGISIAVDKNFNDDEDFGEEGGEDICPVKAAAMDAEAAEEIEADNEANEIDSAGEDIVGAEEDAKEALGQASSSEDLETSAAENRAELSPAEASNEDDQPGAIEKDLPLESAALDDEGFAVNDSDVNLQGQGYDNGEDAQASGATLPGNDIPGSSTDVSSDTNTSDQSLSGTIDSNNADKGASVPGEATSDSGVSANDSDQSLSSASASAASEPASSVNAVEVIDDARDDKQISSIGRSSKSSLPGKSKSNGLGATNSGDQSLSNGTSKPTPDISPTEVVGADGDDSNGELNAEIVDKEDDEVNTSTPSEEEMNSKESLTDSDSLMPRI